MRNIKVKRKAIILLLAAIICCTSCESGKNTTPCEGCGVELSEEEGINTVLGMWLCENCVGKGMGGTTPPPFDLPEE